MWRALESVRHPQVARVEVVGSQVWVQYQPGPAGSSSSSLDVAGVLVALGEAGVDARELPASKILSVTGRPPLLVCVASAGFSSQSWKPGAWFAGGLVAQGDPGTPTSPTRGAQRGIVSTSSSSPQPVVRKSVLARHTSSSVSTLNLASHQPNGPVSAKEPVPVDTQPLPLLKRPGRWKIAVLTGVFVVGLGVAGLLVPPAPQQFECPGEEELEQVVADLLTRRAEYLSAADLEGLASIELPDLYEADRALLDDATAHRRRFLASPLDVVVTSVGHCDSSSVRVRATVRGAAFEACTLDRCINVAGTDPQEVEIELELAPWRLRNVLDIEQQ